MASAQTQILVIGAGYAGMMAALRLAGKTRKDPVEVTLINSLDVFVQRPQLVHMVAEGKKSEKSIHRMLRGSRVAFRQGWVSGIDPERKIASVMTPSGKLNFHYDYLVYTLGSSIDQESVPGIHKHAYVINPDGPRSVIELRHRLQELSTTAGRVVVVGGGATGIEAATEIRARYPNLSVSLVTDGEFGAFRGEKVKRQLRQAFQNQGIPFNEHKKVNAVMDGAIAMGGGEIMPFEVCVWAGGFRPPLLARQAGLSVNSMGQILTDPFGRSVSHPDFYAAGDAAIPLEDPGVPVRMGIFAALTVAAHVADNLTAAIQGKPQKRLSFSYYGQGITLGSTDALGLFTYPDDQPRGPIFRGRLAVSIREFAVWLVAFFLETERRWPGSYFWLKGPRPGVKPAPRQHSPVSWKGQVNH